MSKGYEQRKQANEKYLATQERVVVRVPKEGGLKDSIQAHADGRGESMQAFILRAVKNQMERDKRCNTLDGDKPAEIHLSDLIKTVQLRKSDAE